MCVVENLGPKPGQKRRRKCREIFRGPTSKRRAIACRGKSHPAHKTVARPARVSRIWDQKFTLKRRGKWSRNLNSKPHYKARASRILGPSPHHSTRRASGRESGTKVTLSKSRRCREFWDQSPHPQVRTRIENLGQAHTYAKKRVATTRNQRPHPHKKGGATRSRIRDQTTALALRVSRISDVHTVAKAHACREFGR
jgi:hypothetical protein